MFFLIEDDQVQKHLPCTLFLRLLKLTVASIDRYEPWDQDSLVSVAQNYLKKVQSLPQESGEHFKTIFNTTKQVLSKIRT